MTIQIINIDRGTIAVDASELPLGSNAGILLGLVAPPKRAD